MNIEETGEVVNLVPIPRPEDAPAVEIDMPPVGPTVADPVTGELSEIDTLDVEADDSSWVRANA